MPADRDCPLDLYDATPATTDDTTIVAAIAAIWRFRMLRVAARARGAAAAGDDRQPQKIKRLMREHGLQPSICRHHVAMTDSDHGQPIYPNRVKD
jgi:putative transposase